MSVLCIGVVLFAPFFSRLHLNWLQLLLTWLHIGLFCVGILYIYQQLHQLINKIREMAFWYNQANSHIHTRKRGDKEPKYRRWSHWNKRLNYLNFITQFQLLFCFSLIFFNTFFKKLHICERKNYLNLLGFFTWLKRSQDSGLVEYEVTKLLVSKRLARSIETITQIYKHL